MPKTLPVRFFASTAGNEPVREFLLDLSAEDRRAVGVQIAKVEFGWPIGMPVCRPLRDGLYEVRVGISSGRIVRVILTIFRWRSDPASRIHQEDRKDTLAGTRACPTAQEATGIGGLTNGASTCGKLV